jgi:predicted Zn-dependent peptidase
MTFNISNLNNKFKVVSYDMPGFNTTSINLIVGSGSRNEENEEFGIAHFLEHMAFKGTKTRTARMIAEEFDAIGGQFNAYTSKENTVYFAKVLSEHTEKALEIISDIINNSLYDQSEIDKEYDVICQEIAQTLDNPDELCYENLMSSAFKGSTLGKSILGTEESIKIFNKDMMKNFIDKHYNSDNMILSVAGKVDHSSLEAISRKTFSFVTDKKTLSHNNAKFTTERFIARKQLEQTTTTIGFESISYKDIDEFYKTQILSLILGGGFSSRLFQTIREKHGLAYSVGSFNSSFSDTGMFTLYLGTSHDKTQFAIDKIKEEITKISSSITEDELIRAKNQIKACTVMAEEKTSFKSEEIGKNYLLFGKYIPLSDVMERIMDIQTKDLEKIANNIFSKDPAISILTSKDSKIDIDSCW